MQRSHITTIATMGISSDAYVTNNGSVVNRGTISGVVAGSTIGAWKGNAISE